MTKKRVAVIGLGYVGLPLALQAESKGFDVVGIDLSKHKIAALKNKKPVIDDERSNKQLRGSSVLFTDGFSYLDSVQVAVICVPTPVSALKKPDLSFVKNATLEAAKRLKSGSLLIIESTINPGVCDEILIPLIEQETSHKISKTLFLAHCPERINPGDAKWHVGNISRVVGADSPEGLELAYDFYINLVEAEVKKMAGLKEAEAVKIIENSFRDVNIAFVNELAMSFGKLGINVKNVIDGAATKPFAFMPHYPGIGVGGHCIPVDPYYLIEYALGKGFDHKFLSLGRSINESMPVYAVNLLEEAFIEKGQGSLENKKILVLGLSYKADVGDDRESPAYSVIHTLQQRGAIVTAYDPYILDRSDYKSLAEALKNQQAAVLVTAHDEFMKLNASNFNHLDVFVDGRNSFSDTIFKKKCKHTTYIGMGT